MRPIKKGQQLFTTYLGTKERDDNERRSHLYCNFGFICECEMCEFNYKPTMLPMTREFTSLVWMNESIPEDGRFDKQTSLKMQKECIKLLQKYGSLSWNDDLKYTADTYRFLINRNNC